MEPWQAQEKSRSSGGPQGVCARICAVGRLLPRRCPSLLPTQGHLGWTSVGMQLPTVLCREMGSLGMWPAPTQWAQLLLLTGTTAPSQEVPVSSPVPSTVLVAQTVRACLSAPFLQSCLNFCMAMCGSKHRSWM